MQTSEDPAYTERDGFYYLPVPDVPGMRLGARAIELPGGLFVGIKVATDADYAEAAALSTRRLLRCRPGSRTWLWHRTVIAEHERRRRARLTLVPSGSP